MIQTFDLTMNLISYRQMLPFCRHFLYLVCCTLTVSNLVSMTSAQPFSNNALHLQYLGACDRSGPLGMINGDIQDWQISTSSTYPPDWDRSCHERFGRLYQPNGRAWCPKYKTSSEWLQVDLGVAAKVTGVMTQGRGDGQEWVQTYLLSYSMDAYNWKYVTDYNGNRKILEGNSESYSAKHVYLTEPIMARFIRFHTLSWHGHPSLRVEIIGCQVCKNMITLPPFTKMSASSEVLKGRGGSCRADDGLIISSKAWCAKLNQPDQWLQFDVGPPTLVTGVVTMGRGDTKKKHWVTRYRLAYSNNTQEWHYYNDASHLEPKEFGGNVDKDLERYHYLNSPFVARFIRIYPLAWNGRISMRAGLIGCTYAGKCMEEFMKINDISPCVENLAYRRATWVNSYRRTLIKRHTANGGWLRADEAGALYDNVTVGTGSNASDDVSNRPTVDSCVVLTSQFVDRPTMRVDLGRRTPVSGVMLTLNPRHVTLNSSRTVRTQHWNNVDRLDVYVDNRLTGVQGLTTNNFCGSVNRANGGLFRSSVHVHCVGNPGRTAERQLPLRGRFVYVELVGAVNRSGRAFSGVVCDVKVYN